jgi:hypothetical protein
MKPVIFHADAEARTGALDASALIEPNQSYLVWSPDTAFAAAAAMLKVLEEETNKQTTNNLSPGGAAECSQGR